MQSRRRTGILRSWPLLLVLCLVPVTTPAFDNGYLLLARGSASRGITLNEAVRQVQQETGGRVLSAATVRQGGRQIHRIKVLTPSGRVRVYSIDAGGR